ncbi:hypothetical protein Q8A73_006527 [Channa argus]|nr:hypothetical protein Q8A73_006527 [Channa argus]
MSLVTAGLVFMRLLLAFGAVEDEAPVCQILGSSEFPLLSKEGEVMIGGAFSIHSKISQPPLSFTEKPTRLTCSSVNLREFRYAQTMIFAIEEINRSDFLLPNISIGYRIYDNCASTLSSMRVVMALMNGDGWTVGKSCSGQSAVHAIIGESESSSTIVLSRMTGPFNMPVISHSATCECLSSRNEFPSFFRTIASDVYQGRALAQLVKHFGWTWVGAVNSDSDYGNNGMAIFLAAAQEKGVCVEYREKFHRAEPEKLLKVVEVIQKSTARVIVAFMAHVEMNNLLEQLTLQNITGRQFIGVEAWITADSLVTPASFNVLGGSLGFAVQKANISGLEEFLIKDFWETDFKCNETNNMADAANCKENHDLIELKDYDGDVAELRMSSNIYKAIYAVANSLHHILKCSHSQGCDKPVKVMAWQVVESLKQVNFTIKNGEQVWFDNTGATVAQYEVDLGGEMSLVTAGLVFMRLLLAFGAVEDEAPVCQILGSSEFPLLSKEGEVMIGGAFSIHSKISQPPLSFTEKPTRLTCSSVNLREFRFAQTMIFAIEEINRSDFLLPNISIGYRIYDNCASTLSSMRVVMALMNGDGWTVGKSCSGQSAVHAIIGESESSSTIVLSRMTGPFNMPVISHSATCECLSSRKEFPSFFRTIASDLYQSRALAQLVKHFGWTWVGAVNSDSDYGNNGMAIFLAAAQEEGVCVEYREKFHRAEPEKLLKVVEVIQKSTARVIVAFMAHVEMNNLLEQLTLQNITGRQFIGVEAWITADSLVTPASFNVLGGSLGFAVQKANISGLEEFLIKDFWETDFKCNETNNMADAANCKENHDLTELKDYDDDVAELRYSSNIYKAIYAVANSLHRILKCSHSQGCDKTVKALPLQVVESLKQVNFTIKNGEQVWFDNTGATVAQYEVVNWQRGINGSIQFKPVGYYDASLPPGRKFVLKNEDIMWPGEIREANISC